MTADPTAASDGNAAVNLRDRALVAFLLSTGCRISEALALDRADWNLRSVIVRGKGDVERSVVITDRASPNHERSNRHGGAVDVAVAAMARGIARPRAPIA